MSDPSVLRDLAPEALAALIAGTSDVALVLGRDGMVHDVALSETDIPADAVEDWVGRPFRETLAVDSVPKLSRLLETGEGEASSPTHLNHPRAGGDDLPVRYRVTGLNNDRLIALGRDMSPLAKAQRRLIAAQQASEREYARLRGIEARYRQYFHLADEPALFADANQRITEANRAAQAHWQRHQRLLGRRVMDLVPSAERPLVVEAIDAARSSGSSQVLVLKSGRLIFAPLRHEPGALLVRLAGVDRSMSPADRLARVVEVMPDGFVVTDAAFNVIAANSAFAAMTEAPSADRLTGASLERWLGRPGVDLSVIRSTLADSGTVRGFSTVLVGDLGQNQEVDVSAVKVADQAGDMVGLSVRAASAPDTVLAPRSAQQLAELVGRVPIKEIVRETTDTIERMCIEAALELSGDNRASAAELLGLSRQSLYVKMRRYGIAESDTDPDPNAIG